MPHLPSLFGPLSLLRRRRAPYADLRLPVPLRATAGPGRPCSRLSAQGRRCAAFLPIVVSSFRTRSQMLSAPYPIRAGPIFPHKATDIDESARFPEPRVIHSAQMQGPFHPQSQKRGFRESLLVITISS